MAEVSHEWGLEGSSVWGAHDEQSPPGLKSGEKLLYLPSLFKKLQLLHCCLGCWKVGDFIGPDIPNQS